MEKIEPLADENQSSPDHHHKNLHLLTLAALGVVYGDIGTSPLYAMRECFHGPHSVATTSDNILGVLSLILWSLISLISIIAKLIFFNKRKYHLVRPALTVAVFILIFVIAHWTYQMALDQTIDEAKKIQHHCNQYRGCPAAPAGWHSDRSRIRKTDLGIWLKYSASYHSDGESFSIRLYQGPDLGEVINGGVGVPFTVHPYQENQAALSRHQGYLSGL